VNRNGCDYESTSSSISRDWGEPGTLVNGLATRYAQWQPVISTSIHAARGVSVSLSAKQSYVGRLAFRIAYTDRPGQVLEVDAYQALTLWLPGSIATVHARIEPPVDFRWDEPLATPEGSLEIGALVTRADFSLDQKLFRTWSFFDPNPDEPFMTRIPPCARWLWINASTKTLSPNIREVQAVCTDPEDLTTYRPLAVYDSADSAEAPFMRGTGAPLPSAANYLRITAGPDAAQTVIHTLTYLIQP
jgi:hypothetical protein